MDRVQITPPSGANSRYSKNEPPGTTEENGETEIPVVHAQEWRGRLLPDHCRRFTNSQNRGVLMSEQSDSGSRYEGGFASEFVDLESRLAHTEPETVSWSSSLTASLSRIAAGLPVDMQENLGRVAHGAARVFVRRVAHDIPNLVFMELAARTLAMVPGFPVSGLYLVRATCLLSGCGTFAADQLLKIIYPEVFELLPDKNGRGPLMRAVMNRDTETVAKLLNEGADVNQQDYQGESPLDFALHPIKYRYQSSQSLDWRGQNGMPVGLFGDIDTEQIARKSGDIDLLLNKKHPIAIQRLSICISNAEALFDKFLGCVDLFNEGKMDAENWEDFVVNICEEWQIRHLVGTALVAELKSIAHDPYGPDATPFCGHPAQSAMQKRMFCANLLATSPGLHTICNDPVFIDSMYGRGNDRASTVRFGNADLISVAKAQAQFLIAYGEKEWKYCSDNFHRIFNPQNKFKENSVKTIAQDLSEEAGIHSTLAECIARALKNSLDGNSAQEIARARATAILAELDRDKIMASIEAVAEDDLMHRFLMMQLNELTNWCKAFLAVAV